MNVIGLFYKFASAQALQVDLTGFSAFDSQPALYDGATAAEDAPALIGTAGRVAPAGLVVPGY